MSDIGHSGSTIPLQFMLPSTVSSQWKTAFERMVTAVIWTRDDKFKKWVRLGWRESRYFGFLVA